MKKGKLLTGLLTLSMVMGQSLPALAAEEEFETDQTDFDSADHSYNQEARVIRQGIIGTGDKAAKWSLDDQGKMVVGSGSMEAIGSHEWPWQKNENRDLVKELVFNGRLIITKGSLISMLSSMPQLVSIDVTALDTAAVQDFTGMFSSNKKLEKIDLGSGIKHGYFRTYNATKFDNMFAYNPKLTQVGWFNYFDTSNVTSMDSMFRSCTSLTTVGLHQFDTRKVKRMDGLFQGCTQLRAINLSSFTVGEYSQGIEGIFRNCKNLQTFNFGPKSRHLIHQLGYVDETGPYTYQAYIPWSYKGKGPYCAEYIEMYLAPKDEYGEIKRWKDATISSGNPNSLLSLHRLYNPNSGEHFYTCEQDEKDHLVSLDWKDEDAAWKVPKTSDQPVYRLYNPNNGDHHFTTSEDEKESLVKVGWKDEGIGFYVHPMNEKDHHPVYRQ